MANQPTTPTLRYRHSYAFSRARQRVSGCKRRQTTANRLLHLIQGPITMADSTSSRSKRPLLTIPNTADRLNVSTRTVWRLIDAGKLPVIRIGRSKRIAEEDLEEAIEKWREDDR